MHLIKKLIFAALILLPVFVIVQNIENKKLLLPNGWTLFPAGRSLPLGDLPLNIAVSKSKKLIAVTNNGQSVQSIQLINPVTEKVLDNVVIPKSWYGLRFLADEKYLYASGGNDNWILKYAVVNNKLILNDSILLGKKWPNKISPAGIDIKWQRKMTKEKLPLAIRMNMDCSLIHLTGPRLIN